jgi:hypothetical protein
LIINNYEADMAEWSRRNVLLSLCGIAGIGGCLSAGEPSGRSETTAQQTLAAPAEVLSLSASITAQPTEESPPVLQFLLENDGSAPTTVTAGGGAGGGYALGHLPPYRNGESVFEMFPVEKRWLRWEGPQEHPLDGSGPPCWHWPDSGGVLIRNHPELTTISPGDSYSRKHYVFTKHPQDQCAPQGTYRAGTYAQRRQFAITIAEGTLSIDSAVTVGPDRQFSARASLGSFVPDAERDTTERGT